MAMDIITWADAQARGLKRYFTGKPCKRGHIAERLACNGMCFECANLKNRANRAKDPEKCRERYREWRAANPDKAKAAKRSWEERNPDKVREHAKRSYAKNKPKRQVWQVKYSAKNRDQILARALAWAEANPEKAHRNKLNWNHRNPDKVRTNGHNMRAKRRSAEGRFTKADIDRIFKAQKGKCAYCRTSLANGFEIDHIIALAKGGTNHPSNIQLCCEPCNCSKGARDPIVFAQLRGFLL